MATDENGFCLSCGPKPSCLARGCRAKAWIKTPEGRAANLAYAAASRLKAKRAAVDGYGGKCRCCGETELAFLTINHVYGGGNKHRAETSLYGDRIYRHVVKEDFPPHFDVLCFNCQHGVELPDGCPHKVRKHRSRRSPRRLGGVA